MPKPMLKQPQIQTQANNILSATQNQQQKQQAQQMDKMKLDIEAFHYLNIKCCLVF